MLRKAALWAFVIGSLAAGRGLAAAPEAREEALEVLAATGGASGLRVWVNDGSEDRVKLGDRVVFHFAAESDGYLTALYLDGHGVATLLFPTSDPAASRLRAGEERSFPPAQADWELQAQLPLGRETIFALLTTEPITAEDLGVAIPTGELLVVDADGVPDLAQHIAARAGRMPAGSVATARAEQIVVAPLVVAEASPQTATRSVPQYTKDQIVSYFTTRHRSIRRPKLDLNIKFDFNSANLTESAKRDLDEVGKALVDGRLSTNQFVLAGHTDDVGTEAYNEELSQERARAARTYLVKSYEVDPKRLATTGFGESQPLVPGESEEARAMNRRVVLEMVR
jgi:outer membrane protein OmpA-like peptidoglycan-associated protein